MLNDCFVACAFTNDCIMHMFECSMCEGIDCWLMMCVQRYLYNKPPKEDDGREHGAITMAKAVVGGVTNIGAGLKQAGRTVVSDVRDQTIEVTQHKYERCHPVIASFLSCKQDESFLCIFQSLFTIHGVMSLLHV